MAISVADTGTSMLPAMLKRLFEPFFTTKPLGQSTGLGLSRVYGFVRQLGGLVRIKSAPGRDTTVRLLLPLHEHMEVAEEPRTTTLQAGPCGIVPLVDDKDAAWGSTADRLGELGHTALEARDGPEALRILATTRPAMLVTDIGLPNGMNERQVAEATRDRQPNLPVLFITGSAGTSLPPGVELIDKPFDLDLLVRRVGTILEAGPRTAADRGRNA
ncbi:response regulator [Belnapia sp. T18]|uniref:histidine kinase n=1 Tax=Belnapia arida TaxID=2804533 RepID=A0ABS1UB02_9PROT|nr:ATP-binding protein [Belnapia arida]MBL6081872.1 response regulator [Belnapia arida]